jgi:hypothetical protein
MASFKIRFVIYHVVLLTLKLVNILEGDIVHGILLLRGNYLKSIICIKALWVVEK